MIAKIAAQPVVSFVHDRKPMLARTDIPQNSPLDDGTVITQYGKTKVYVNLGDVSRTVGGYAVFGVASKTGEPVRTIEYACQCGRAVSRRFRTMTPGSARGDA